MSLKFLKVLSLLSFLVAVIFAGWTVVVGVVPDSSTGLEVPSPVSGAQSAPTTELRPVREIKLSSSLERPLFSRSRRPYKAASDVATNATSPPAAPVAVEAPSLADVKLMGVSDIGNIRSGLFASPEYPTGNWIGEGDLLLGWKVDKIDDDTVFLSYGPNREELRLYPKSDSE